MQNGNAWCHPEFLRGRGRRTSERIIWKRQTRPVVCLNTGDLEGFNNEHVLRTRRKPPTCRKSLANFITYSMWPKVLPHVKINNPVYIMYK